MREIEKAVKGNCELGLEHSFIKIRDEGLTSLIRIKLPELIFPLWECEHCEKITEST